MRNALPVRSPTPPFKTPCGFARSACCRSAVVVLVLLAAVGWRYSSQLSAEASALGHEWSYIHQTDALHVEQAWAEGALVPFWTPWIQCGAPLFAVPTKPFTYPPFVIGILALGPYLGMNLLTLAHLVLGGGGTVLLLRRLGTGWLAATLGGLLFALAARPAEGFFTVPFGHGYAVAWWPFTTLALVRVLEGPSVRRALPLGLCPALQIHAGGELSLYWLVCFLAVVSLPFLVRRSGAELVRIATSVALAVVVCLGLSAVKLLPELEWLAASGRGETLDAEWALDPQFETLHAELGNESRLVTLAHVVALNYRDGGAATLLVGLLFGVFVALRNRAGTGILLATCAALVIASGVVHEELFELLPGYDKMRWPTRFLHTAGFGATLVAAYGFDFVFGALGRGRRSGPWLQGVVACALVALLLAEPNSAPEFRQSALARLELARRIYAAPLVDDRPRIFQRREQEQALWVGLGIESTGGAFGGAGSANATYAAWMPDENAGWHERENRFVLDALGVGFTFFRQPLQGAHLEFVFGPRCLDGEEARIMNEVLLPRPLVYRREGALTRVSLVDGPTLVVGTPGERETALRAAFALPFVGALTHVFVESETEDPERLALEETVGVAGVVFAGRAASDPAVARWHERAGCGHVVEYPRLGAVWTTADADGDPLAARRVEPLEGARVDKGLARLDVELEGTRAGFLLVSELMTLQRGWTATVDGRRADLARADGLISALRVPEGARHVSFRYVAPGFRAGLWITACCAAAWIAAWALAGRRSSGAREGSVVR